MSATKLLLYLAIGMIPLGRLMSEPLFESAGKAAPVSPIDAILGLLILVYCGTKLLHSKLPMWNVPGFKAIALFPLWCLVSLAINKLRFGLSIGETAFSGLYLARWIMYGSLYFITYEVAADKPKVRKLVGWLLLGALAFAAVGIIQVIFFPYDFALVFHPEARAYLDFDPQGRRLVSTFFDPNIAAGFLLIPAMITVSFCIHGQRRWRVPCILLMAALIATLSRGGAVGFLVGLFCLLKVSPAARKGILKVLLAVAVLLFAMYPVLRDEIELRNKLTVTDLSAAGRLAEWTTALGAIRDNWITGIGFNTFGYVWPQYGDVREGASAFGMENDFVMILLLTGVTGGLIYFRMYRTMLAPLAELGRRSRDHWEQAFGRGVWAATLAVAVSSFFTTLILYPHIMGLLWILWALGKRLGTWTPTANQAGVSALAPA